MKKRTVLTFIFPSLLLGCGAKQDVLVGLPPGAPIQTNDDSEESDKKQSGTKVRDINLEDEDESGIGVFADKDDDDLSVWNEDDGMDVWDKSSGSKTSALVYAPIFEANGWPYQDDGLTFRVFFDAPTQPLNVYAEPDLRQEPTTLDLNRGDEIVYRETVVSVVSPSIYRAKREVLVEGFTVARGYRTGNEGFSKTLKKGTQMHLLLYSGSGLCFVGIRNEVAEVACPTAENFSGRFSGKTMAQKYQPSARVWWLQLGPERGSKWLPLDNRFVVDIN